MNFETRTLKAEDIPNNVFVYMPDKKMFFYVDGTDVEDQYTTLVFEPDDDPKTWVYKRVRNSTEFQVLSPSVRCNL